MDDENRKIKLQFHAINVSPFIAKAEEIYNALDAVDTENMNNHELEELKSLRRRVVELTKMHNLAMQEYGDYKAEVDSYRRKNKALLTELESYRAQKKKRKKIIEEEVGEQIKELYAHVVAECDGARMALHRVENIVKYWQGENRSRSNWSYEDGY
jgi:ABC-type phosphate transport system auxiliary subunit